MLEIKITQYKLSKKLSVRITPKQRRVSTIQICIQQFFFALLNLLYMSKNHYISTSPESAMAQLNGTSTILKGALASGPALAGSQK
jgi:hypothetical protein